MMMGSCFLAGAFSLNCYMEEQLESWQAEINNITFTFQPFFMGMETRFKIECLGASFVMALDGNATFRVQSPETVDDVIIEMEDALSDAIYHHDM